MAPAFRSVAAAGALLLSWRAASAAEAGCPAGEVCAAEGAPATQQEVEDAALLQQRQKMLVQTQLQPSPEVPRIAIDNAAFKLGDAEAVLIGGNYVVKAPPYFPEPATVMANAQQIHDDVMNNGFQPTCADDGTSRVKVPVVRLGAMMEGWMPNPGQVDENWLAKLEATVQAFASKGVYVVLDAHSDAWSTTNGGAGFPWWMSAHMQEEGNHGRDSYVARPENPLELAFPPMVADLLRRFGAGIPEIKTYENDPDPWKNFSYTGRDSLEGPQHPSKMNIGNLNMRLNNNDAAWGNATLLFTKQVQNSVRRFLKSHSCPHDRRALFEPYLEFIKALIGVWERHPNVIMVELLNEPPPSGLPSLSDAKESRALVWSFYAQVLRALDKEGLSEKAPLAVQDVSGTLPGANELFDNLFKMPDNFCAKLELEELQKWAQSGHLVLSFHFYPGFATQKTLNDMVALAHKYSAHLGHTPIFLSEFWTEDSQEMADTMTHAIDEGCDAVAYWHYVDTDYTGTEGWYKFPMGDPISDEGVVDWPKWQEYLKTVEDGTFWGADITGGEGGATDVLGKMRNQPGSSTRHLKPRGFPGLL